MNILYFAPIKLWPDGHGNIATVHQYIKRMRSLGHKVHYVYFDQERLSDFNLFYSQKFVDTFDVIKQQPIGKVRNEDGYYIFDSLYQNGLGEKIRELCDTYKIDVIICTYIMHSKLLEYVPSHILKIIDTHDKMTDRHLSLKANNIPDEFFSCTKEDEAKYLSRADIVWARRDEETEYFNKIIGEHKTITVSHFNTPHYLNKDIKRLKRIGFLASDNNVNAKMVQEFVVAYLKNKNILNTDLEVIIGGNVYKILERNELFSSLIKDSPIKLIGKVDDIADFYQMVDAVIVPIMFGTGINVKMIEAMSFGIPIISTKCGIKGCDNSSSDYHKALTLDDLIEQIYKLYNHPEDIQELTQLSKQLFEQFFEQNARKFDECFTAETVKNKGTKEILELKKCSGCGVCAGICNFNALKMVENANGFYRPIKQANCQQCLLCDKICALKNPAKKPNTKKADSVFGNYNNIYAVYSKHKDIRFKSSTGGFIKTFLMNNLDKFDGVIALCESDNPLKPEFKLLKNITDILTQTVTSKYFAVEASKAAEILKEKDGNYIVVGLPCQIAALKNASSLLKANFFSIELFCGAVFSLKFLRNYIEFKKAGRNSAIEFRNKKTGWHNFSLTLKNENADINTTANEDEFFFAQRNKIMTQNACIECSYCHAGVGDIQVGDFWGDLYDNDEKGVNLVITRSDKADELLNACPDLVIEKRNIQDVHKSQPWFIEYYRRNVLQSDILPYIGTLRSKEILNNKSFSYINDVKSIRERYFESCETIKENENTAEKKNERNFLILPPDTTFGSFGDQKMFLALMNKIKIKYPKSKVSMFNIYSCPEDGFLLNNGIDIITYNANGKIEEKLEEIRNEYTDLIIIGADILDGAYGVQNSLNYFKAAEIAHLHGKNVRIQGFSFNSTKNEQIINAIKNVSEFTTLCVRDLASYERLKNIGCKNIIQVTDMAFSFDEQQFPISNYAKNLYKELEGIKNNGKKLIGIHLTCSREKYSLVFIEKIMKALKTYKDAQFIFFPHDIRVFDEKLSDYEMAELITKEMTQNGYNCINAYDLDSVTDVKYVVSLLDLLISSRMHIVIGALSKGIPAISFVYQDKFEGLYKFYDFKTQVMFNSDTFLPEELEKSINYIIMNNKEIRKMIETTNKKVLTLSQLNFDF